MSSSVPPKPSAQRVASADAQASKRPRFGIPTRISLAFGMVLLAFVTISFLSVRQHASSAATLRLLDEGQIPLYFRLSAMRLTEWEFDTQLSRIEHGEGELAVRWLNGVRSDGRPANLSQVRLAIERAERLAPSAADRTTLERVEARVATVAEQFAESEPDLDALRRAVENGNASEAARLVPGLHEREELIDRELRSAMDELNARITDTSGASAIAQEESVTFFEILGLIALIAGLFVAWWTQRLLQPLPALEARVLAVARGDLSQRIEPGKDDEIGRLGNEFERMVAAISARDQRLRELQRTQDEIVATLRSGIVVVGVDGTVRATNRAAATILGEGTLEVGAPLDAHGACARVPGLSEVIDEVALRGEPVAREAIPLAGKDGRSIDLRVSPFGTSAPQSGTSSVSGPDGRRPVLAVFEDVSEALATKARLLQSERLAAMGRMAAHVTHEVRNPLSSIGLNVDLLSEEVAPGSEAEALLKSIQREIDRLTAFTEEYLRLARVPSPLLHSEPIDAVVKDTARFVQREMENAKVTLAVSIEPHLSVVAYDEAQIRQALLNLLRNAREAMPSGGTIEIRAAMERDGVALSVADRGEGIAPDVRARIFDLFYSTKERGTGLGLALTREIVLAHGGEVRCEDREGGGTLFTIWLPAERSPADRSPADRSPADRSPADHDPADHDAAREDPAA